MPYQPGNDRFFFGSHPQVEGSSICKLGCGSKTIQPPHIKLQTNDSNARNGIEMDEMAKSMAKFERLGALSQLAVSPCQPLRKRRPFRLISCFGPAVFREAP